jgi:hypothetical protein
MRWCLLIIVILQPVEFSRKAKSMSSNVKGNGVHNARKGADGCRRADNFRDHWGRFDSCSKTERCCHNGVSARQGKRPNRRTK